MTTAIDGTRRRSIVCMLRAIAPPWPRSSAPAPGNAPGVSMSVITGAVELVGERHDAHRLAVALRPGHAEVAVGALGGVAALLVADHGDRAVRAAPDAGHDGGVVAVEAVAVQLLEVGEEPRDVVERVGPVLVAGELDGVPDRRAGLGAAAEAVGEAPHEAAPAAGWRRSRARLVLGATELGGDAARDVRQVLATAGRARSARSCAQVTAGAGERPEGRWRMVSTLPMRAGELPAVHHGVDLSVGELGLGAAELGRQLRAWSAR